MARVSLSVLRAAVSLGQQTTGPPLKAAKGIDMSRKTVLGILTTLAVIPLALSGCGLGGTEEKASETPAAEASSPTGSASAPAASDPKSAMTLKMLHDMFNDLTLTDAQIIAESKPACDALKAAKAGGKTGQDFVGQWTVDAMSKRNWKMSDGVAVITYAGVVTCPDMQSFVTGG